MPLDARLKDLLACPQDQGPLVELPGEPPLLLNPRLGVVYSVDGGVPQLLAQAARPATVDELSRAATGRPA